jgi:uncharacterized repeat protein (TIGR04042 family)
MPELLLRLRWPDGAETVNYSPSSVIRNYFRAGDSYGLEEFLDRARNAMTAASARVQEVYGYPCSRAQATLAAIEAASTRFETSPDAAVTVVDFGR